MSEKAENVRRKASESWRTVDKDTLKVTGKSERNEADQDSVSGLNTLL